MQGVLLCMSFVNSILITFAEASVQDFAGVTVGGNFTGSPLCGGKPIVKPNDKWLWDSNPGSGAWPSCTSPPAENQGRMCQGDPTSIVMQADGSAGQCLVAQMLDC